MVKKQIGTNRKKNMVRKMKAKKGGGKINNPKRTVDTKDTNLRSRQTIKRLKMYKQKPRRNSKGKFLGGDLMGTRPETPVVRVQPNRKWFGNTRIIGQKELDTFREEMKVKGNDPYTVILKRKQLPVGLLADTKKVTRANILQVESFRHTFGKKRQRKRPKLKANSLESMLERAKRASDKYSTEEDSNKMYEGDGFIGATVVDPVFLKGQSERIKGELYKVIDSSDVLIQVLDARDPLGTRGYYVEKYLKTQCQNKHLILVLNKCDLVPTWVTARWIKHLSSEYPTLAFHAHISKSFGKGSLIQLLRQFQRLHPERQKITIGFFGYPNTGKSSVINALRAKVVCKVAPIPGETKVWQYITLTNNIYLLDCPGVVYPAPGETNANRILKGVVRCENVKDVDDYIDELLNRVRPEYLTKTYNIDTWNGTADFLSRFAVRYGKLQKGGEPDYHNCAIILLHDWVRGKLPWFVCPPFEDDLAKEAAEQKKQKEIQKQMEIEEEADMDFEPVQLLKQIQVAHAFSTKDASAEGYFNKLKKQNTLTPEQLASIEIENPLGLPEDDPLIIDAKTRKYFELHGQPASKI